MEHRHREAVVLCDIHRYADDEETGAVQMQFQANEKRPREVERRDGCIDQAAQPAEIKRSLFEEVTLFRKLVK